MIRYLFYWPEVTPQLWQLDSPTLLLYFLAGLLIGAFFAGFSRIFVSHVFARKQTKVQLEKYAEELADLYNNALCGYHSLDENAVFVRVNDTELKWLGYAREELIGKRKFSDFLTPNGQQVFQHNFEQFKKQGWIKNLEYDLVCKDGSILPVLLSSTAIESEDGKFVMSRSTMFDITERKRVEIEAIRNQDLREAIFNESADAIFLVDPETLRTMDCNLRAIELYEADHKQQLINIEGHLLQVRPCTEAELEHIVAEMEVTGVWNQELEYVSLKGNIFWGNLAAKQIKVAGKVINLVRVTDVTARKQAEEQLRISLQEKEVLLKEIHHRVKNNLHVISSLLDLQSERIEEERILNLFTDSQNRIQAMALIHEQLYQSHTFGKVEFSEYIYRLISNLSFSYSNRMQLLQPIIQAETIYINLDTAVPCGLLINELVTNAFKHAFPDGRSGKINIQLYQDEQEKLHLKIADDGIGLPTEIDWKNSASLGLKLVSILAKQLKATITFDKGRGTNIHLVFTELKCRSRL